VDFSDFQIYQELIKGQEHNSFYKSCAAEMLRMVMEQNCVTRSQTLNYLGERFRVKLMLPEWYTNEQFAEYLLEYVPITVSIHHAAGLALLLVWCSHVI
jgi:DNA-directed RNA polymerase I subunit RPA2